MHLNVSLSLHVNVYYQKLIRNQDPRSLYIKIFTMIDFCFTELEKKTNNNILDKLCTYLSDSLLKINNICFLIIKFDDNIIMYHKCHLMYYYLFLYVLHMTNTIWMICVKITLYLMNHGLRSC
jgi:hypothetical protein